MITFTAPVRLHQDCGSDGILTICFQAFLRVQFHVADAFLTSAVVPMSFMGQVVELKLSNSKLISILVQMEQCQAQILGNSLISPNPTKMPISGFHYERTFLNLFSPLFSNEFFSAMDSFQAHTFCSGQLLDWLIHIAGDIA